MLAIVVEVIDDETTSRRHDDGDHGVMPVTKVIMPRLEDGDQKEQNDIGHIMSLYDLHVMFVMFTSYLRRTIVA